MTALDPKVAFASFDDFSPLTVDVECTNCRTANSVSAPLLLRIEDESLARPWLLRNIYTCPHCNAIDEYEVSPKSAGVAEKERRYVRVNAFLHDGSRFERPSQALSHLRHLAEQRDDADIWQRLGNACSVYGLESEARDAWRRALDRDQNDFEVICHLVASLWEDDSTDDDGAEVLEFLSRGVCLIPSLDRDRPDRLNVARWFLSYVAEVNWEGAALTATWRDPDHVIRRSPDAVGVYMSSVRMDRIGSWEALARFLIEADIMAVGIHPDDDVETHTILERLVSRDPMFTDSFSGDLEREILKLGSFGGGRDNVAKNTKRQASKRRSKNKHARKARRKNRKK